MASVIISSIERILISIVKRERNVDICSEYRLVVLRALRPQIHNYGMIN